MSYNAQALAAARLNHPSYRTLTELSAYVDAFCNGDDQRADEIDAAARERISRLYAGEGLDNQKDRQ
jgi:hypothetical protein